MVSATPEPLSDAVVGGYALQMGDNCLILSHRISEWCGHAPALEEDIAQANIALDLIGQAQMWLGLAGNLLGKEQSADDLAYRRDAHEFRNILMVERPNGDFGHTVMRQFLFDVWHHFLLEDLRNCPDRRIGEIAEKSWREVAYHLERSSDLVIRLGDGSDESHARMQMSLDELWPFTGEMFKPTQEEQQLIDGGWIGETARLAHQWDVRTASILSQATLLRPDGDFYQEGGKRGVHSEHMGFLLAEMQFLQRAYPGARW